MRVLVTGAAGFVGSTLSEALIHRGHEVVGLDAFIDYYSPELKRQNLRGLMADGEFRLVEADLRSAELEPLVEECDAVVHAAAMPGLPRSWTSFELYSSCNLLATQRLADACRTVGVEKLVYISTSSVYGRSAVGDETLPIVPISPYGVTKLAAENLLTAYREMYGLPVTTLRYFSVYGPRQRPDMAWNIFIDSIAHGRPVTVYGDGQQSRSCTFVTDAVDGTIRALEDAPLGEVYNIGGGEVITVLDAIGIISDALGREPRLVFQAPRPGDQRSTAAVTTKAERDFGYRATVSPRDGLFRQAEWQMRASAARVGGRLVG